MFTKIKLKNFRSFHEIEFDLTAKNGLGKHLAIIYGENGAGKSNLFSAFVFLTELLETMNARDLYKDLIDKLSSRNPDELDISYFQEIQSNLRDIPTLFNDYHLIGSNEPLSLECEFNIWGNVGRYDIALWNDEIIYEKLEYLVNKRRGTYFECSEDVLIFNSSLTKSKELYQDIKKSAKRYWGKHSILAIILHELTDKSYAYGEDNISTNLDDVLAEFRMLSYYGQQGQRTYSALKAPFDIFKSPEEGIIHTKDELQLEIVETVFSHIFCSISTNIKGLYYKRKYSGKKLTYQLFIKKNIAGKCLEIPFSRESTGNHQLLRLLCYLFCACMGATVIIDEADSGIHDLLFQRIINEIHDQILGQLIMTTHNTLLLESPFARESTYILTENNYGITHLFCLTDYEKRLFANNNIRTKYLNNEFGGLPKISSIDFAQVLEILWAGIEE